MAETHLAVRREKQAGDAAVDARSGAVGLLRHITADDAVFLSNTGGVKSALIYYDFFTCPMEATRNSRSAAL